MKIIAQEVRSLGFRTGDYRYYRHFGYGRIASRLAARGPRWKRERVHG